MNYMTVVQLRHRAKEHGLKGISRMRKAELISALESIRHRKGDRVRRYVDGKMGNIIGIQEATFDGVTDSTVQVRYDDAPFEVSGTSGAHHAFVFVSRPAAPRKHFAPVREKMPRTGYWALSQPCTNGGTWDVRQGHADYCATYGHATYTTVDLDGVETVHGWCPRCGFTFKTAEQTISERDTIDQRQMVDVMTQVVDNGREDLIPVLDKIDAARCQVPDGRDSTIPRVHFCPRCADSTNPCDECVLAWLVDLFKITGDVKLTERYSVEFDCYA